MANELRLIYGNTGSTVTCKGYYNDSGTMTARGGAASLAENSDYVYAGDASDIFGLTAGDMIVFFDDATIVGSESYRGQSGELEIAYPRAGATVSCKAFYSSSGTLNQRDGVAVLDEDDTGIYFGDKGEIANLTDGDTLVYYDDSTPIGETVNLPVYDDPGEDIEEAVFLVLISSLQVTSLVSERIYPKVIPQNTNFPAVVYSQISGVRQHTLENTDKMVPSRWQFTCVAETYTELRGLSDAVKTALNNYVGTVGTVHIQNIHFIDDNLASKNKQPIIKLINCNFDMFMITLDEYLTPEQLLNWAKANLNIIKLNSDMTDDDIRRAIRWVGMCAVDTIFIDGDKPKLGRHGIGLMLSVTLIEFPEFYLRYELSQFN